MNDARRNTTPTCETCGWVGKTTSAPLAAHALRIHSCAKQITANQTTARRTAREAAVDHTPKPCTHKQAAHQHGTRACYVLDRCRCRPCSTANTTAETWRIRQQAYGRWNNLTDADPIRAHVTQLRAAGLGLKQIARASGVPTGALSKLVYGERGRPPSRRVRRETATKILHLTGTELAAGHRINSTGTRRRVQALVACGWSIGQLVTRAGIDRQRIDHAMTGRDITTDTANRIRALYDQLWNQPPPEADHREKIAATRSRNRARANNWPPPLAWDDDTIDNPDIGPAVVPLPDTRADRRVRVDDIEWLIRAGGTWESIAARLDVTKSAIDKRLRDAARDDLLHALRIQVSA